VLDGKVPSGRSADYSESGSCEFTTGSQVSRIWAQLPEGDYYRTIWTNNANPNCCLLGDIRVSQQMP